MDKVWNLSEKLGRIRARVKKRLWIRRNGSGLFYDGKTSRRLRRAAVQIRGYGVVPLRTIRE